MHDDEPHLAAAVFAAYGWARRSCWRGCWI